MAADEEVKVVGSCRLDNDFGKCSAISMNPFRPNLDQFVTSSLEASQSLGIHTKKWLRLFNKLGAINVDLEMKDISIVSLGRENNVVWFDPLLKSNLAPTTEPAI